MQLLDERLVGLLHFGVFRLCGGVVGTFWKVLCVEDGVDGQARHEALQQ